MDYEAGKIYVNSSDGSIYSLGFDGKQIWKRHYGKIKINPLVKDGKLIFVSEDNVVFCIGKHDGNLIWFFELKNNATDIKIVSGMIAIGCFRGYLFLLGIPSGELLGSFKISDSSIKKIVEDNNKFLFELENGKHCSAEIK